MQRIKNRKLVEKLDQILGYEINGTFLYLGGFFYVVLLMIAIISLIIFVPFMVYVLFKEKRKGWLYGFFFGVLLPTIITCFVTENVFLLHNSWVLLILPFYFFYFFILKFSTREWLREDEAYRQFLYMKEKQKREKEIWNKQFSK